ncbi:class I SAM-dependent methyltransferase [Mycobacterium arosiense]|uniref:SAM-dependent methyltransferase n=1 Tax=Mycobacterium arosiense ATCC BAA-1401 = DSM 45069 TaxID=1265311 RepID=A0A1W9ZDL4_MYCAI|nr:class I SAM-dependent methyltransferase [Mycobacterium arosiense]ORA12727.1 SAM-dependent methyltransferase [Mycobacterium arosiense ATCC BAA-1401 = DSM 45069]
MNAEAPDRTIASMPRGGPDASWLDRRFQTDELEYLDREDAPDEVKQKVIAMLDRLGGLFKMHEKDARTSLDVVQDVPSPRILELGAGHGKLSAKILELHPKATVTVTDLDPTSVANIGAEELGTNPRARTQVVDATAIDAEDDSYDLVVFAQAFHHLPPAVASRAIVEATRVGKSFLVIDLERRTPVGFVLFWALRPLLQLLTLPSSSLRPLLHDGYISALRAYSPSALQALAHAADPAMSIEFLPRAKGFGLQSVAILFRRPDPATQAGHSGTF